MSRYFGPTNTEVKKWPKTTRFERMKPMAASKFKKKEASYEGDFSDPYHGPASVPKEPFKKYQQGKRLDTMSRYFGPTNTEVKKWPKTTRFERMKPMAASKFKKKEASYEGDFSDPYHGPAAVPKEPFEKYQQGKRLDTMSCFGSKKTRMQKQPKTAKFERMKQKTRKFKEKEGSYEEDFFDPYQGPVAVPDETLKKYQRGNPLDTRHLRSKFERIKLKNDDKKIRDAIELAARSELLLHEDPGFLEADDNEDTFRIKQKDIAAATDITSASKLFNLSLKEFGPYKINYSRDGRHLLLGGYLGHVASMDWVTKRLLCEINVMESVHNLCWLHLPTMFATAQKQWVYIYDNKGVELHCIKKLNRVLQMEFLPYHFLLVTSSEKGFLSWLDVSIGKLIKETYTNAGRLTIMCQNPYNAVVATGHPNGTVSMWSPNVDKSLASVLCHAHPIRSIAIDNKGLYMATASVDRTMKIFDVRTFKCLQSYKLGGAAGFLNFSQLGLLGVGLGNVVEVYKDCCTQVVKSPYMRHKIDSTVSDIQFCPYEDVLGIGYSSGFSSILIPGSGQPNFDAYESNPYMTKSQRREIEVKSLLEKIQPELITLNPGHLGAINIPSLKESLEKMKALPHVRAPKIEFEPRLKAKGRSKSARTFKRKQIVQETAKRKFIKTAIKEKSLAKTEQSKPQSVLDRFKNKSK